MKIEIEDSGVDVVQQYSIPVNYRGRMVGDFYADLLVEGKVIIELKAVQKLAKEHEVQLVNYLAATGIDNGLLINFGSSVEIKRKFKKFIEQDLHDNNKSC